MLDRKFLRRDVIKYLAAAGLAATSNRLALAAPAAPHPNPRAFQSGDFLWPALPGAIIPRSALRGAAPNAEEAAWEEERRKFIESVRASGNADEQAAADELERLTYEEFQARYFQGNSGGGAGSGGGGGNLRGLAPRGIGIPQVGHVAIVEVDGSGAAWVIEATPKSQHRYESLYSRFTNGVIRTPYSQWIEAHKAYNVWHGRLKDVGRSRRARIVAEAKPFLGKDYWFWSFSLNDETAFYCSKLVWLSVWKAINVALDGDQSFSRNFWVTPKQLVYASSIKLLHNPGAY